METLTSPYLAPLWQTLLVLVLFGTAAVFMGHIVTLARADLTGVTTRGKGKDRYLWLQAGDRKQRITERGLPDAEAFDHLVAPPPLDPAPEQA